MARRSQCSSAGDNPLDPNYLPPHYREEYRLAIDALVEEDLPGYYQFLQKADVVDFLSSPEIQYIQESVQLPQQSSHSEQRFPETGGDGSSDTYWPIHSDLDAPGLDLGWPQMHHFIGPTEVTTLVNPPEPDMPSIKEQARRLIKNAQQVVAIVMDTFTDVDIFQDILTAATRNVAVYVILDEQNAHHFVNMVSNCRVNLQSIQFLRVRTVSGITYHCRSGKSFKGQMMDRFLLTDCRAVLSGNYSFMWSFEKVHRCMAHLFLGQLVSTFDEEFRILFAQSQPLIIENTLAPMENVSLVPNRQYPGEVTSLFREPRKFLPPDTTHPEEWARHPYDERTDVDWRMMPFKKRDSFHGPVDMSGRFPSQQARMDPSFEQGPSRIAMMENPALKRHSYAEGGHGRYSFPFLPQQGPPEPENQGRQFHRWKQPLPGPGKEAEYSAYDKFWNQDYLSADQYSEPGLPQEIEPPNNFDPVLNYLSSTRNVDFDQGSDKLPPAEDVTSSYPRRLSLGQPYACQTSPTPSNPSEQKQFFLEPNIDRKDPIVKRGLRDWRISSYLSAYDDKGDEGLPLAPPNVSDAFEEYSNPQQTTPDLPVPKIPNVREFKVPSIPRASQMPGFAKTTMRELPKKLPDESSAEAKTTPSPSESSSTTEGEKSEEVEQKELKPAGFQREESFRRKYNPAVPRSSRLRSSLIFSSLEQQQHTSQDTKTSQQDEESDKNETEQTKQPFVSPILGRRRSAKEPFEWNRFTKSATFDNSATDSSKPDDGNRKADDKDSSKVENVQDLSGEREAQDLKPPDVEPAYSSPAMPGPKPSEPELSKTDKPVQPPKSLLSNPPFLDMSDPDARLMFFKELAAKRKAAKAAESEKGKVPMKPPTEVKESTPVTKETPRQQETAEKMADCKTSEGLSQKEDAGKTVSTGECKSVSESLEAKTDQENSKDTTTQSCKEAKARVSTDSEMTVLKNSQPKPPNPAVENSSPSHPPTPTNAAPANAPSLVQGTDEDENPCLDSTSNDSSSLIPDTAEAPPSPALAALESNPPNPEVASISSPPLPSEQHTGSESTHKSIQSSSDLPDPGAKISPSLSPSSSADLSTSAEAISSDVTLTSSTLSPEEEETAAPLAEPGVDTSSISETESNQDHLDSLSQAPSSSGASAAVDTAHVESDIAQDTCIAASEPSTSSPQSMQNTTSEEATAPEEKDVPGSENSSAPQAVGPSKDDEVDSTTASLNSISPEPCLPHVSDLESESDQNKVFIPTPSPADPPSEPSLAETNTPFHPEISDASQSEASPQDAPKQATPPTELSLTGRVTSSPAESVSCSPLTESVGSVLSPEAEKTSLSALPNPTDTNSLPEQDTTDSSETVALAATETCSSTEPTSNVPTEPESHLPEQTVPAENSDMDNQNDISKESEMTDTGEKQTDDTEDTNKVDKTVAEESACSDKTNDQVKKIKCPELPEVTSEEVVPPSPQSKQPKSNPSRYHSSTANVLSSSNLRDDTKLLLEQISANSQSRNEATKEAPVTDDEKEDEADKNAIREKERGIRYLSRGQPKSNQDRDKLLERIQSMRKERKVYSRFEMGP